MTERRRALAVLLLSATAAALLVRLGQSGDAAPTHLAPWDGTPAPAETAVEVARLVGLVLSAYLALVCLLALARDLLQLRQLPLPAPAIVRRLLGLGVVGALSVPTAAFASSADAPTPTLVLVEPAPTSTSIDPGPVPTVVQIEPAPSAPSSTTAPVAPTSTLPPPPPPPTTDATATEVGVLAMWRVSSGDSFWSIAERVVASRANSATGEADVARYWRELIDANRERLAVAGNPDLIFPGQELRLPPVTR